MLSLANVGNGAAGANYYESADNYYSGREGPSDWWGVGAASLGLHGAVDAAEFATLLDGRLHNGDKMHHAATGRRGGTDGTFSAPKSVSLQSIVGGDRRIIGAHRTAVDRALAYAETIAACRVTNEGITHNERTGNLLVARFTHDLSRACDPQLHTHCVMINATQRAGGEWRAVNNEAIYRHKMLLGALYRAELARELQVLGYALRVTHIDDRFELDHFTDRQLKAFSQRSAAIEAYLKTHQGVERDQASAWDKKMVAVITRERKTDVDRAALREEWDKLSAAEGIKYSLPALGRKQVAEVNTAAILAQALAHVSERRAVFRKQDILQAALERGVGVATLSEIEIALTEAIQAGIVIREGERFTTRDAQELEREILEIEMRGRNASDPIYTGQRSTLLGSMVGLAEGQRNAALGMLLSANQIIGIQGRAGVGKTTLLAVAADQASKCGYTVKGLAPSANAARELAGVGISTETIASFSHRQAKGLNARTLLIVDEAGMVSSCQLHTILSEAAAAGCRVVLVGDTAQLESVEAGRPFAQLQGNGMHTGAVNQIQRQKNPLLKRAVELAVDGQAALAVEILNKHVIEISDGAQRYERIAADYIAFSEAERIGTRVIAGTRHARSEINRCIRAKLDLDAQGDEFILLDRKDLTAQQARSILSYDVGDLVRAETDYRSLGLKRGETAAVVQRLDHCIVLQRCDGARVLWRPALATKLTGYIPMERPLSVGDLVRITANDHGRGLVNGDLARVSEIAPGRALTLLFDDGRMVELDGRRPLALDYGYCSTVHASQGLTCERVLIEADSHSLTTSGSTFYVAISRARHHAQIYTDDRDFLPAVLDRKLPNESALDVHDIGLRSSKAASMPIAAQLDSCGL